MSERSTANRDRRVRDAGMSLAEVLVSVLVMGMMVTTLALATEVILRQSDNTEGRVNNARSEQNVGLYMPADLASAEDVDAEPDSLPCGPDPACPQGVELGGSNAVMLSWRGEEFDVDSNAIATTRTNVSYRVIKVGTEFRLIRVQCSGFVGEELTCSSVTVLRDLDQPPADIEWFPGTTRPSWIISVTAAGAADAIDGAPAPPDPGYTNKNAQRVVVTVNGGGDAGGAGGGRDQISLSAGGTNRQTNLSTDDLAGAPTFTAARSRCGGNFGVIVDNSGSIGSTNMSTVRGGIGALIDAFAGTPVKLQVVAFNARARTLGATDSVPGRYYDMLIEADVSALRTAVSGISSGGTTNYEDGFFRMLRNPDGTVQSQLPGTVLFFTDGVPTVSRLNQSFTNQASAAATSHPDDAGLPAANGSDFSQLAWNRAERLLRDRGAIELIGVYVNPNLNAESSWNVRSGYHLIHERANNVVFQQGSNPYQRASNLTFQTSIDGDLRYERLVNGSWQAAGNASNTTNRNTFLANNTTPDSSDGWRTYVRSGGSISTSNSNWVTVTEAQYNAGNLNNGVSDGFRTRLSSSATSWVTVTLDRYNTSNTTSDDTDGWRVGTTGWSNVSESTYHANNLFAGDSDGWRTSYPGGASSWTPVTTTIYDASNTNGSESDGWRARKVYDPPYDYFDSVSWETIKNYATIGNLMVGNTTGVEGGFVEALPRGGPYTNAAAADLFVLPDYSNFGAALASVALGQCGGTVTVQTRVGTAPAQDPFTYENLSTNEIVQTSAAFRSGTFDIALPGGGATEVTISPQQFTNLVRYAPAGWSCRSGGVNYPFTTEPVDGHAPWTAIRLTVNPNQAVSCIQQVVLT